jgi:hypothetical protein
VISVSCDRNCASSSAAAFSSSSHRRNDASGTTECKCQNDAEKRRGCRGDAKCTMKLIIYHKRDPYYNRASQRQAQAVAKPDTCLSEASRRCSAVVLGLHPTKVG